MARLGDICNLITDGSHFSPQACDKGYPMMSVKDMEENDFSFETCKYISESDYRILVNNGCRPQTNDVLLAKDGSYFKYAFVVKEDRELTLLSSIAILRPKTQCVDPNYLRWFLMAESTYRTVSLNYITGTALKRVILQGIKKIEIPLPALEEQQKIALQLEKVSDLIALRKQQLAKLDELVKSRFIEMFGDLHSTNFPKCKMGNICGIKHGYAFSGEFFTEEDNNILLVTPGNFKVGGGFQEKRCKFFTGEYSKEYVLNGGDLIVTMTDLSKNMDTLGYSAIVPCTDRVYLHNQRIGLLVDMSEIINRIFLMYFMQTNDYRDNIIASATGSTVHHTSPSKILDCDVFVPPMELQEKFAAFVEQTDKSKVTIQTALIKLETLKKALMQQYFS